MLFACARSLSLSLMPRPHTLFSFPLFVSLAILIFFYCTLILSLCRTLSSKHLQWFWINHVWFSILHFFDVGFLFWNGNVWKNDQVATDYLCVCVSMCDCQTGIRPNHVLNHYHFIDGSSNCERVRGKKKPKRTKTKTKTVNQTREKESIEIVWIEYNSSEERTILASILTQFSVVSVLWPLQLNTENSILHTINCYLMRWRMW